MPRDSSGNYTLPGGNPVVSGTTITSSWANGTMSDIANEIGNSLSRDGQGGMRAAFKFDDGAESAPSATFTSETTLGFYKAATQDWRFVVGAQDRMRLDANDPKPLSIWNNDPGAQRWERVLTTGDPSNPEQPVVVGTEPNQTVRWDGDKWVPSSVLRVTETLVGIGTDTPGPSKLNVVAVDENPLYLSGGINDSDSTSQITLNHSAIGPSSGQEHAFIRAGRVSATNDTYLTFGTNGDSFASPAVERMRVDADGNVGIGTTTPDAPLHVNGIIKSEGTVPGFVWLETDGTADNNEVWNVLNADALTLQARDGSGSFINTLATVGTKVGEQHHGWRTENVERMRLTSEGLLGIGLATPDSKLHIGSSTTASASSFITFGKRVPTVQTNMPLIGEDSADGQGADLGLCATSSTGAIVFYTGNGSGGFGAGSNAERLRIEATGRATFANEAWFKTKIGVNTAPSNYPIEVAAGDFSVCQRMRGSDATIILAVTDTLTETGRITFRSTEFDIRQASGPIKFSTPGNNERIRIKDNGYVGINVTNPLALLEVNCSDVNEMRVSRTAGSNQHIATYSNASANFMEGRSATSNPKQFVIRADTESSVLSLRSERASPSGVVQFMAGGVTEIARFTNNTNFFVGKTSGGIANLGVEASGVGYLYVTRNNAIPLHINRRGSTGTVTAQIFYINDVNSGTIDTSQGGTPSFAAPSDVRLKRDIRPLESQLERIRALQPKRFFKIDSDTEHEGFVAQDVQEVYPDLVRERDEDNMLMVSGLGTVETRIIKALQELADEVDQLKTRIH